MFQGKYPVQLLAMHNNVYWHRMLLEDTTYGQPCAEVTLAELRGHLYRIVLPRQENLVNEYGRSPWEPLRIAGVGIVSLAVRGGDLGGTQRSLIPYCAAAAGKPCQRVRSEPLGTTQDSWGRYSVVSRARKWPLQRSEVTYRIVHAAAGKSGQWVWTAPGSHFG